MSQSEHIFEEAEQKNEEWSPAYRHHSEEEFYPAHQKLQPKKNISALSLSLRALLALFSVVWVSRFLPDTFNPAISSLWPILVLLNACIVNVLFYLLTKKPQQKIVHGQQLFTAVAWITALLLVYISANVYILFLLWPFTILVNSLLFYFLKQRNPKM